MQDADRAGGDDQDIGLSPGERNVTAISRADRSARHVVCTLGEGSYLLGIAGLVNSLVRAGFAGEIIIGYRGALPRWLDPFRRDGDDTSFQITPDVLVRMVIVEGGWHLNNAKAHFIADVAERHAAEADLIYYLDSDIVVTHPWPIFAEWAMRGVVLVHDIADSNMSPHHAYRYAWRDLAVANGYDCREVTGYFNGGCIGFSRRDLRFVLTWRALMDAAGRTGIDMTTMKDAGGRLEFARRDQDVLNAAVMATDTPLALLGYEAMGQYPWINTIIPHAINFRKPWQRNYIFDALRGFPANRTHLAYWRFVDGPTWPFTPAEIASKKRQLAVARFISLLHVRSFRDL
ncbi:hypothetical protein LB518_07065 [Mesorhizobium sp. BR1-1-16]|uniref:hypothetical protein n=1 Tax=Mesorhizobium sp. BR1-1-16 TaxID=2876653 RepID=UPI001CCD097F|nr:hypothetical protein [Mesorhizobium sp. BR1-1-16]MBZ9936045.1 hypothetical protein [Mesorhizobium sp. BR1-1-16]